MFSMLFIAAFHTSFSKKGGKNDTAGTYADGKKKAGNRAR